MLLYFPCFQNFAPGTRRVHHRNEAPRCKISRFAATLTAMMMFVRVIVMMILQSLFSWCNVLITFPGIALHLQHRVHPLLITALLYHTPRKSHAFLKLIKAHRSIIVIVKKNLSTTPHQSFLRRKNRTELSNNFIQFNSIQ